MRAVVVFDSFFGNTEKIARAVGAALAAHGEVEVVRVTDAPPDALAGVDALVVGSPTRAFRATPAIRTFVRRIPRGGLRGVRVAAFDTRIAVREVGSRILSFLVRLFGYAAEPTDATLRGKGGVRAAEPAGFIVEGSEGPLREGELERAAAWTRGIASGA